MNTDDQKDIDKSEKEPWPEDPGDPNPNIAIQISKPSPETEMEVHHHPQLDHKPKPWKEYLLEGLMIFIAVMLGFFAENIREDITNNEHVRQLTSQMVQDLKADTARLDDIIVNEKKILRSNDTLFNLLQQPLEKLDTKNLQKVAINAHGLWPFHPSLGAIIAIKNELHLKQFSNSRNNQLYRAISKAMLNYCIPCRILRFSIRRNFLDPFLSRHFTPTNLDAVFSP